MMWCVPCIGAHSNGHAEPPSIFMAILPNIGAMLPLAPGVWNQTMLSQKNNLMDEVNN
jgi:hypothetical protein